jgi:HlyD family secretion protein
MRRSALVVLLLVAVGMTVGLVWRLTRRDPPATDLMVYGTVDLRQVDLPFTDNARIAEVLVQEGDRVRAGQVLARLDVRRLQPRIAQAEAQAAAQREAVARLRHGNRPQDIAEARAAAGSARVDAENARLQYSRIAQLAATHAVSEQDADNLRTAMEVADAKVAVNEKALELEVEGPRQEDIHQAEAQLQAAEAEVALLHQELVDAQLVAPTDAVVRSRLMEPGEMAFPTKPIFSLAITDPKWVRAYVTEPNLSAVRPGMRAAIGVDAFPTRRFDGWVGFISPVAEFTPKDVQTEALRPSLVYEVRVFVHDSADVLRLGMPATVHLDLRPPSDTMPRDQRLSVPIQGPAAQPTTTEPSPRVRPPQPAASTVP